MSGIRRDYLLNQIDLLRQFVARLVDGGANAGLDDMLQLAFSLQEKLFGMPPAEFLTKEVSEQINALQVGESAASGREKCLTYAQLLKETAALYDFRGRGDLAAGARQLALHVVLIVALQAPDNAAARDLAETLIAKLDLSGLHAPVRELLDEFRAL
jgi:hypothetical protein